MKFILSTKKDFNEQACYIIKKLRKENNISQKRLAKILGVTQARISYIESGKSTLTLSMFQDVVNCLIN